MPDHRLQPLTPLGHAMPETVTIGPVTIAEVVDTALASLATRSGRDKDVARIAKARQIPLPGPGKHQPGAPFAALWLGPAQWMIEAPLATHEAIEDHLRLAFGDAASITEQTDAWVRFDLTGTDLPAMLERLTALDIRRMQPGDASRTVIEHLGTYLICRTDRFTLYGPRSSARSLHHALAIAARSAY